MATIPYIGLYEQILLKGLETVGPSPWSLEDLSGIQHALGSSLGNQVTGPHCTAAEVTDWLRSLEEDDLTELLLRLNHCS